MRSDLGARIVVAIPLIALALFIVVEGGVVFLVGLIALGLICLHELYTMYAGTRPVRIAGFLGLIGLLCAAHFADQFQIVLVLVLSVAVAFLLGLATPREPDERPAAGLVMTVFGVFWVGLGLAHAILLRDLPHGAAIVIDVLVGTFLGDTGAYLGGRAFGRRPLAPSISPNKSVEGLIAGMIVALAATWFAGLYQDWLTNGQAALLGLGVAVIGPIGDLFESYVKRSAGTKDAGSIFGAHGGALDRLDAVIFTAVVGYYIWFAML